MRIIPAMLWRLGFDPAGRLEEGGAGCPELATAESDVSCSPGCIQRRVRVGTYVDCRMNRIDSTAWSHMHYMS